MSGREKFQKYKIIIELFVKIINIFPKRLNIFLFRSVKNWNGTKGLLIRYIFLRVLCEECGDNVFIDYGVEIKNIEKLKIGKNVSIHQMSYIDAIGGVVIGDNVSIAHSCSLISFNHTWNNEHSPIKYNELSLIPILISSDVWIACGVRILAGCVIEKHTVIGANAVLTEKKYESNYLYGGVPAKKLKKLKEV